MLYSLVGQGVTVVNSTAYLDEAERCVIGLRCCIRDACSFAIRPLRLKSRLQGSVVGSIVSVEARRVRVTNWLRPREYRAWCWSATRFICLSMMPSGVSRTSSARLRGQQIPFDEIVRASHRPSKIFLSSAVRRDSTHVAVHDWGPNGVKSFA